MQNNESKKEGKARIFFKKAWCMLKNNWAYKILALATAFIMWLVVGYIF